MEIHLVGGAVRDELLGWPFKERDWVVVGATPDEMLALGYRPVGKDFPVFLHPQTNEEYALARTERKTAPGYHGFSVYASPQVTLEEDLLRRDFTINAIAKSESGQIIDPQGGRRDLDARVLRHVSPAFSEDPVRILRAARFIARYQTLGFVIAPETQSLMRAMVDAGEVDALVPERVWQETFRALQEAAPQAFFLTLRACGALKPLFPEIDQLFGVPQPAKHHPEIDTGVHCMMVLEAAARLTSSAETRFAALVHDLGKGKTPSEYWPKHHGHEARSVTLVEKMCARLRAPRSFQDLAIIVAKHHGNCHRAFELRPETILKILEETGALREKARFEQFLVACEADSLGRSGHEDKTYPQAQWLKLALAAAQSVQARDLVEEGLTGEALGQRLKALRVQSIADMKARRLKEFYQK